MKCQDVTSSYSELFEGALSAAREAELRGHLASCADCALGYQQFEEALGALHGVAEPGTSPEIQAAIMGAIDAVAEEESDVHEERFRRAVLLAQGRVDARERRLRLVSHTVAALVGAAAIWLLFFFWPWPTGGRGTVDLVVADDASELEDSAVAQAAPEPVIEIREVIRTVEKRVEVPIEVPVEVPVEVLVERVVRRGPLFEFDTASLAVVFDSLLEGLDESNRLRSEELLARAEEREAERDEPLELAAATEPDLTELSEPSLARHRLGASVSVRRENGQLRLLTRGALSDLVPVLLSRLSDDDPEVVALVERQLEQIRQRAEDDPDISAHLVEPVRYAASVSMVDRLFGGEADDLLSWEESWSAWWTANRELLIGGRESGLL